MLYELIAVIRPGTSRSGRPRPDSLKEVKQIAKTAGELVVANGGVIRGFTNWGTFLLTKPVWRNQAFYDSGHHFIMRFDASAATQRLVHKTVAVDPRSLRCGVVKLGSSLKEVCDVAGKVEWRRTTPGRSVTDMLSMDS